MANRTRNRPFCVRLTDKEYALWLKKHKTIKLGKTDYFIRTLKDSIIKVYSFDKVIKNLHGELRKIGVNLNQIAYYVNSGYFHKRSKKYATFTLVIPKSWSS